MFQKNVLKIFFLFALIALFLDSSAQRKNFSTSKTEPTWLRKVVTVNKNLPKTFMEYGADTRFI
jgi:hypothetical protein